MELIGEGTAVLLRGGYLLTAKHVSCGKPSIDVKTQDKKKLTATLVSEHPGIGKEEVDLALYRIDNAPATLPYLVLATDKLQLGEKLMTVEAENTKQTVRAGIACELSNATWPWKFDSSLPVDKGNSGGAIVNQYGEMIGIVIQTSSVMVKNGNVSEQVPGGRGINLLYPAVNDWLRKYV